MGLKGLPPKMLSFKHFENTNIRTKDFIYLTMLAYCISTEFGLADQPLEVIEYFAGCSRVCKLASWCGFEARGFELKYDSPRPGVSIHSNMPCRSAFDFCGEAGFLSFAKFKKCF